METEIKIRAEIIFDTIKEINNKYSIEEIANVFTKFVAESEGEDKQIQLGYLFVIIQMQEQIDKNGRT